MTPINQLDTNYGASTEEKNYIKETLDNEKEGVKALFDKERNNLHSKIIRNFHNDNYELFDTPNKKIFDNEKIAMKNIIDTDPDMKNKYEAVQKRGKAGEIRGFSEGILLLQAIAIKCVNVLANKDIVEKKLSSRNDVAYKSKAMDGILGPNTFYVLASIAKEKGISFNGVVDKTLLDAMINICGQTPVVNNAVVNPVNTNNVVNNTVVNNPVVNPVNTNINNTTKPIVGDNTNKIVDNTTNPTINIINQPTKILEQNISQIETDFLNKKEKPIGKERTNPMITITIGYEELFKKLSEEQKQQKIKELETKQSEYKNNDYQYGYYNAIIKSYKEKIEQEKITKLENYTLNMVENNPSTEPYSFQKENGKNKVKTLDTPLADGTKYQIYMVNGQWSPIGELQGKMIDKNIVYINFKEDGTPITDKEYTSTQEGEQGNIYTIKNNENGTITIEKTGTNPTSNEKNKEDITQADIENKVKEIQKKIKTYTLPPQKELTFDNTYTIETKDITYNETKTGYDKIETINFMVKNNGKEVGIIKFDNKGELLYSPIDIKDTEENEYIVGQQGNLIIVQKQGL